MQSMLNEYEKFEMLTLESAAVFLICMCKRLSVDKQD